MDPRLDIIFSDPYNPFYNADWGEYDWLRCQALYDYGYLQDLATCSKLLFLQL